MKFPLSFMDLIFMHFSSTIGINLVLLSQTRKGPENPQIRFLKSALHSAPSFSLK